MGELTSTPPAVSAAEQVAVVGEDQPSAAVVGELTSTPPAVSAAEQVAVVGEAGPSAGPQHASNLRRSFLVHLAEDLREAIVAGDLEVARVAHDALGRLLGSATMVQVAPVIDLTQRGAR